MPRKYLSIDEAVADIELWNDDGRQLDLIIIPPDELGGLSDTEDNP